MYGKIQQDFFLLVSKYEQNELLDVEFKLKSGIWKNMVKLR